MFKVIGGIIDKGLGIVKQRGDGTNRAILNNVKDEEKLKKATNISEKINKIVLKNISKFDRRDQRMLAKYIDEFDSLD